MPPLRSLKLAVFSLLALAAAGAGAQAVFHDYMVQPPQLDAPQRGSLAGQYGRIAFGPADLTRGGFSLPCALAVPTERGGPGVDLVPVYSPDSGLSEWGMGWQSVLALTRWRSAGDLDYRTDELSSPWGHLALGSDGAWYPQGLQKRVRVDPGLNNTMTAALPDGSRWTFGGASRIDTSAGTYSWYLTDLVSPTGRQTHLTWIGNGAGRLFLSQVQYGGTGGSYQDQVDFTYDTLPQPFLDYRSGTSAALDRRVKTVSFKVLQSGTMTERWRHALTYQNDEVGPAFYLTQVQQTFASGSSAPAVQYGYSLPAARFASATFRAVPKLDGAIAQLGADLFQPNRAAQIDVDTDGRTDFEHSTAFTLVQQQDASYATIPLAPAPPDALAICRPGTTPNNPPRNLAQLRAGDDTFQVVSLMPAGGGTLLTVCNRVGQQLYAQQLPSGWTLGANTRLADLNRDYQPDLVRVFPGGYQAIPNQSSAAGYSFGAVRSGVLSPSVALAASWAHDFNGDGVVDLIGRTDTLLFVWNGLGNFTFNQQAKTYQLFSSTGVLITGLSNYEFTFVDANKDGLTDLILSRSGVLTLYVNTGTRLVQTALPGLSFADPSSTRAVVGDFAGSGDAEIGVVKNGHAYSLALATADTALMASADDGRGNVLGMSYGRSPATPGARHRHAVLTGLSVQTAGHDTPSFQYGYQSPVLHSLGRFLIGFASVVRSDAVTTFTNGFINSDAVSGLLSSSLKHDLNAPSADAVEQRTYEDAAYQGVSWKRLKAIVSGWQSPDGTQAITERTDHVTFEAEVCPGQTTHAGPWGTLTTLESRASLPGLGNALHCLSQSITISGSHSDPTLDFNYTGLIGRNSIGQITQVQSQGTSGTLTLQNVSYNPDGTVASISTPAAGTSLYGYDPATLILNQVTSAEGVVTRAAERDPLTDAIRTLEVNRGAHSYHRFYRYDALERLNKQWNDLGTASELNPNELLSYQYASGNMLGTIWNSSLVDSASAASRTQVDYQTAVGEEVGTAKKIPEGWVFGPVAQRKVSTGETQWVLRPTISPTTDPLSLDYPTLLAGGTLLRDVLRTSAGNDAAVVAQLQANVQRQESTTFGLANGWLVRTVTQNGTNSFTAALDATHHVAWHQDPSGSTTRFFYDALARVREVDLPDGTRHKVAFDDHGRVGVVSRDGIATVGTSYDSSGRVGSKTYSTPSGATVRTVSFNYDGAGRTTLETHTDAGSGLSLSFQYFYDGSTPANPASIIDRGLLTAVAGNGYGKLFTYRPDGSLSSRSVTLNGWRTVQTQLSYFDDGSIRERVITVLGPDGSTLATTDVVSQVDANGRLTATLLGGALLASYSYDGNGLMSSVSFAGGQSVAFRFDGVTRRHVGLDYANGTWTASTTAQLNNRGFLDQESISVSATSLTRSHGYTPEGYLSSATDASNSYGYGYDPNGLISRIDSGGTSTPLVRTGSTLQAGAVTYQFDGLGRVIQAGDLALSYGPDGRLRGATRGTSNWTFLYDEAGVRLAKLSAGTFVAAYLQEGVLDASGLTQPLNAGGTLVGVIASGSFQLVAADARGTVLADTNGTPRIASPYGDRAQHPDEANVIDYVQLGYDADLGVVRMGVRDYDPRIQRFLTPDPLYLEEPVHCLDSPVDCNLYGYARNLPATYRDPDGKNPAILIGAGIGAAISTASYMIFTPVEQWTLRGAGGAALGGAINGAVAGATGGASLLVQVGAGAVGSVAAGSVTRGIQTGSVEKAFDPGHMAVDLAVGAVASGVAARLQPAAAALSSRDIGKMGEEAALNYLSSKGFTNLRTIQNTSGHGIDLVGELGGKTFFFEVKASTGDTVRGLSQAQQNIDTFVTSRLTRAADPRTPQWRDIPSAMREDAGNLLEQVRNGMPIQGQVIEVTNVGSAAESISVSSW
jgi:RHS repeat-associated protein